MSYTLRMYNVHCMSHSPAITHKHTQKRNRNRNRKDGRKPQKPKLCNTLRLLPFYYRWNIFSFGRRECMLNIHKLYMHVTSWRRKNISKKIVQVEDKHVISLSNTLAKQTYSRREGDRRKKWDPNIHTCWKWTAKKHGNGSKKVFVQIVSRAECLGEKKDECQRV